MGHSVSSDASPWPCVRRTARSMWASFGVSCVGPSNRGLSVRQRCMLLNHSVRPVLNFRNSRWPFTKALADYQNRLQRQMLANFISVERLPDEEPASYSRRRHRCISSLARQQGTWGAEHATRIVHWAEHLERPRNKSSLAAILYSWRGPTWLQQRREESGIMRPQTRASPGFLPKRWGESVNDARQHSEL